jgi:hypothetical protein
MYISDDRWIRTNALHENAKEQFGRYLHSKETVERPVCISKHYEITTHLLSLTSI